MGAPIFTRGYNFHSCNPFFYLELTEQGIQVIIVDSTYLIRRVDELIIFT